MPDDVNARDGQGRTAVITAAMHERVAEVRALIDAGADVDL
jgi:ankyrin repeat protein